MKNLIQILMMLGLLIIHTNETYSQVAYECTIVQTLNAGNLEVSVFIESTGATTFKIGGANFRMNVNTSGLNISSAPVELQEGLWDNNYDPVNYGDQATGRNESQGWVSIDIFGEGTLEGVTVPSTPTLVGRMGIPITNTSLNSDIAWRATGLNLIEIIDTDLNDITSLGTFINPGVFPLPVELVSFTAKGKGEKIELKWQTSTEVNNYGFDVERKVNDGDWRKVGFVNGNGNSNSQKSYSFSDNNPFGGTQFFYRLKQIDNDGQFEYSDEVEVKLIPTQYELYQNYPNPFNPITNIKFSLPEQSKVAINIYNSLGELVTEVVNKEFEAGYHTVEFNAGKYASGVYFYSLESNNYNNVKKLLIIK